MSVGENIKAHRRNKNFTQADLGRLMGVSNQVISFMERDVRQAHPDDLIRLAEILDVCPGALLLGDSCPTCLRPLAEGG